MQYLGTGTGSSDPYWGVEDQTAYAPILRIIGIAMSRNPGIPALEGNPIAYVWATGSGNMSLVLPGWNP